MEEGLNREQIATLFEDFKRFRGFPPTSDSVHFIHLQKRVKKMDVTFEQIRAAWALFWEVPKHGRDHRADYDLDNPWLTFKKALNRLLAKVGPCESAAPPVDLPRHTIDTQPDPFQTALTHDGENVTLEDLWTTVKDMLCEQVDAESAKTWIDPTTPHSISDGALLIHVPSRFHANWLGANFRDPMQKAVAHILAKPLAVKFCVCESLLEDDEEED